MKELKLIVAGGRDFADSALLRNELNHLAEVIYPNRAISIVSGMARGADALGSYFAKANNVKMYEFPADWNTYGKRAGFMRNEEMGRFSDALIAFWDGKSKGTDHMISFMQSLSKPVYIVGY